jgi:serine/threonine protein kinase
MWWDEERIEATVTRQFVLSKLRPDEAERLDQPLGFGDGLTDDTYWEWIESKAKRIFLILVDLDLPDQIFGVIDDSWDDDDLPVPLDQVDRLQLTYNKDEKLEKRFFYRQFNYLLRNIQKGENVYYDDEEVVPLELAEKRPVGAVTGLIHSNIDKVHLPGRPDNIFIRRRIPLGVSPGRMPPEEFLSGIEAMKVIEHEHLTSLWASYIHQGCGYLLLTPVNDSNLKAFLTVTPPSIKILAKQDRRVLLLNWIHCLADALSFLHKQGLSHRNIKPSNIMLDIDNHIFLGDTGIFPAITASGERRGFDKETYDYSAPEQAPRPPQPAPVLLPVSRPSTARRGNSINSTSYPFTPSISTTNTNSTDSSASIHTTSTSSQPSTSPPSTNGTRPKHDPQKSDIYSLGTIFLEILTFLLKRASRNFSSHRSAKNKTPGRGGGLPDSSFHKNRAQVEIWMSMLAKDASKKEDKVFRGVSHILSLVEKMLSPHPEDRPSAQAVQERLYAILTENSGLDSTEGGTGRVHCEERAVSSDPDFNFRFDELRLASQRAAAEACANVNPTATQLTQLSLGNGGTIYGIEKVESSVCAGKGKDGDRMSVSTGKSRSSEGMMSRVGSGTGSGTAVSSAGKPKPKAKAWQAPVYAGRFTLIWLMQGIWLTLYDRTEFWIRWKTHPLSFRKKSGISDLTNDPFPYRDMYTEFNTKS